MASRTLIHTSYIAISNQKTVSDSPLHCRQISLTFVVFLGTEKQKFGPASEAYYFPNYPIPKMADFGLAELTTHDADGNDPYFFVQGTYPYYPPVRT